MKRKFLILAFGISFLIVVAWVGTTLDTIIPHRPSAQIQTAQAGPYSLILQVNPNPPLITQPATLSLQVQQKDAPVPNAQITIESSMETMDMGTDRVIAQSQNNGNYLAHAQFSMSGPWQVRIIVAMPGAKTESATFEITAQ